MIGVILDWSIRSVDFTLVGNNKNITNKTISPLVRPNKTPRNLSKPEAPDHLISLLINLINNKNIVEEAIEIIEPIKENIVDEAREMIEPVKENSTPDSENLNSEKGDS